MIKPGDPLRTAACPARLTAPTQNLTTTGDNCRPCYRARPARERFFRKKKRPSFFREILDSAARFQKPTKTGRFCENWKNQSGLILLAYRKPID
jgi:hypothetical protein